MPESGAEARDRVRIQLERLCWLRLRLQQPQPQPQPEKTSRPENWLPSLLLAVQPCGLWLWLAVLSTVAASYKPQTQLAQAQGPNRPVVCWCLLRFSFLFCFVFVLLKKKTRQGTAGGQPDDHRRQPPHAASRAAVHPGRSTTHARKAFLPAGSGTCLPAR